MTMHFSDLARCPTNHRPSTVAGPGNSVAPPSSLASKPRVYVFRPATITDTCNYIPSKSPLPFPPPPTFTTQEQTQA